VSKWRLCDVVVPVRCVCTNSVDDPTPARRRTGEPVSAARLEPNGDICQKKVSEERRHRRNQGVQWVHLHPRVEKKFQAYITVKICKCTTAHHVLPRQSKSQFLRIFFAGRRRFGGGSGSFGRPSFRLFFYGGIPRG